MGGEGDWEVLEHPAGAVIVLPEQEIVTITAYVIGGNTPDYNRQFDASLDDPISSIKEIINQWGETKYRLLANLVSGKKGARLNDTHTVADIDKDNAENINIFVVRRTPNSHPAIRKTIDSEGNKLRRRLASQRLINRLDSESAHCQS